MSVLIKDMKMPTSCDNCWALDEYGDYPRCRITEEQRGYNFLIREKRMDDCPFVPVPPHGRLIDADEMVASVKRQTEIMREIAKEVDKLKPIANSKELDDVDIVAIAETVEKGVLQEIANAPTILEAEEGE